jgi:predicted HAD superfamily Cof-like phosphohydrolase
LIMRHNILNEEVVELLNAGVTGDLVEVGDAITDCLYILIGTAIEFGVADKLPAMFDEVHKSNMSKLGEDGKPIYREDGKVMKGPNYKKPNLIDIIYE